jgi:hypothetical protein
VKAILVVTFLAASCAQADEPADRAAIQRTIVALNHLSPSGLFTGDAAAELARLPKARLVAFPIPGPPGDPASWPWPDHPTVTISHDPWGEATINFPGPAMPSFPQTPILNPRIVSGAIRFITSDVALVEGAWNYDGGPWTRSVPLLFVMKKEGDAWRIASLRVLAPR